MASHTGCFAGNTFHSASISEDSICVVVDNFKPGLVEFGRSVCLRNGETDGVGKALT